MNRLPALVAVFVVGWFVAALVGCGGSGGDAGEEAPEKPVPSIQSITCGDTFADESLALEVPEEQVAPIIELVESAGGTVEPNPGVTQGFRLYRVAGYRECAPFCRTVIINGCGGTISIDNSVTTVTTDIRGE